MEARRRRFYQKVSNLLLKNLAESKSRQHLHLINHRVHKRSEAHCPTSQASQRKRLIAGISLGACNSTNSWSSRITFPLQTGWLWSGYIRCVFAGWLRRIGPLKSFIPSALWSSAQWSTASPGHFRITLDSKLFDMNILQPARSKLQVASIAFSCPRR